MTNNVTGAETDLIYRIQEYQTYSKSKDYNAIKSQKLVTKGFTKDSGYVNPDDVNYVVGTYNNLLL